MRSLTYFTSLRNEYHRVLGCFAPRELPFTSNLLDDESRTTPEEVGCARGPGKNGGGIIFVLKHVAGIHDSLGGGGYICAPPPVILRCGPPCCLLRCCEPVGDGGVLGPCMSRRPRTAGQGQPIA